MKKSRRASILSLAASILASTAQLAAPAPALARPSLPSVTGAWTISPSPNVTNINNLYGIAATSAGNVWAVGSFFNETPGDEGDRTLTEHWNGSGWHVVSSPNAGTPSSTQADDLYGVAAVSSSNVWAVGSYYNQSANYDQPLIEHWNGSAWYIVSSPSIGVGSTLSAVTALSASNIWAVGNYTANATTGQINTLVEHWNGGSWHVVASPNPRGLDAYLYSVTALSSTNIWAVGCQGYDCNIAPLVEHWNGTSWSIVSSPSLSTTAVLRGVTAISASDIWAVGYYNTVNSPMDKTLTEHWNGSRWAIVSSPNPGTEDNTLFGAIATSSSNVWSVGSYMFYASPYNRAAPLAENWNGSSWQSVSTPTIVTAGVALYSIARVPGSTRVWAAGYFYNESNAEFQTLIETHP